MRLFVVVSFRALFDSVYSLRVELIVDKINYSPDTRDAYDSVKYTRADVCFRREYPVYKVEIEDTDAEPVQRAYYEKQQCDNSYHDSLLLSD